MSIALERLNGIGGSGFGGGIRCLSIYESPERRRIDPLEEEAAAAAGKGVVDEGKEEESCSSSIGRNSDCSAAGSGSDGEESCSSSIGRNSDCSAAGSGSDGEESGETEVQSRYKGPLETMDALEESLPIRRSISKFYCGKSKSFTSLTDVSSSSSTKGLAKPDNAYNRKRKNLLAFSIMHDRSQPNDPGSREGGISKRPAISSRCTSASSISMSSSGSNSSEEEQDPSRLLPPRHPCSKPAASVAAAPFDCSAPKKFSFPMRSFSLTDLEGVVSSSSSISPTEKQSRGISS